MTVDSLMLLAVALVGTAGLVLLGAWRLVRDRFTEEE